MCCDDYLDYYDVEEDARWMYHLGFRSKDKEFIRFLHNPSYMELKYICDWLEKIENGEVEE